MNKECRFHAFFFYAGNQMFGGICNLIENLLKHNIIHTNRPMNSGFLMVIHIINN